MSFKKLKKGAIFLDIIDIKKEEKY